MIIIVIGCRRAVCNGRGFLSLSRGIIEPRGQSLLPQQLQQQQQQQLQQDQQLEPAQQPHEQPALTDKEEEAEKKRVVARELWAEIGSRSAQARPIAL